MDAHPHLAIALQNQRDSPLLRLPAKLRNHINGYVLGGNQVYIECNPAYCSWENLKKPYIRISTRNYSRHKDDFAWHRPKHLFGLLQVCRQVHAEAKELPFTSNSFWGTVTSLSAALRVHILPLVEARHINNVRILLDAVDVDISTGLTGTTFDGLSRPLITLVHLLRQPTGLRLIQVEFAARKTAKLNGLEAVVGKEVKREFQEEKPVHSVQFEVSNWSKNRHVLL
ncbi:hypothetical protein CC86DRAFT_377964 [Ophiobolus disseminans]|uniref:Uncharacterized protein n=1 Tax=Ophiobolus disseminans TaxID=1469910 RepID=A0A6A7ACT7_9PLEO|nr:hypothetical protein CC86DRAFT_377964 [Ophiobolus disseminans]